MAEENYNNAQTTSDDMTVLTSLLHQIRGLSPVSTLDLSAVPAEADDEPFELTFEQ